MQTMQQRRAAEALKRINEVTGKTFKGRFKAYVQAMPAMIHMNGLGQTAAFYRSKSNNNDEENEAAQAYGKAYQSLSDWLTKGAQIYRICDGQPCHDLLDGITNGDMHKYRLAQAEALAYLEWLKKFAEAFIEDKEAKP